MTTVLQDDRAVWWTGPLEIDGDGAPDCYGPPGTRGRDLLANAGHPGNWFGLVTDDGARTGNPVVQGPQDPCPGMYVSDTALQDESKSRTDPRRYVDSSKFPYMSVPRNARVDYGLHLGDVGFAYCGRTGQATPFVVADVGPKDKWGEGSSAAADAMGIPSSPRNGGEAAGVTVVVFKGSARGWPRTLQDVAQQVDDLIDAAGGSQQYLPQS